MKRAFIVAAFHRMNITPELTVDLAAPVGEFNSYFMSRKDIRQDIRYRRSVASRGRVWTLRDAFDALLKRRTGQTVPRVRIPLPPLFTKGNGQKATGKF